MKKVKETGEYKNVIIDDNGNPVPEKFREAYEYFEKNKNVLHFPHKFYTSLQRHLEQKLRKKQEENPGLPLTEVIAFALQGLNPNIPGDKLVELTAFVVKTWQEMQGAPVARVEALKINPEPASI